MVKSKWLGLTILVGLLSACSGEEKSVAITPETIVVDGSSTVFPITSEAAKRFLQQESKAKIAVSFSGTTAGFKRFCQGETSISNASRAINEEEKALCGANDVEFVELPLATDALAIVVHPSNKWLKAVTLEDLKTLWSAESDGKVTQWNQVRTDWPEQPIKLYGRGENSGTYDYFTGAVTGTTRNSRKDYVASEDEEFLAAQIAKDPHALGFFGIGAYHRHWQVLRLLPVDNGLGPVYPSIESAADGTYTPFTRPLFLYVNTRDLKEKPFLLPFLEHYYQNARTWMHFTGYLPLPQVQYSQTIQRLKQL